MEPDKRKRERCRDPVFLVAKLISIRPCSRSSSALHPTADNYSEPDTLQHLIEEIIKQRSDLPLRNIYLGNSELDAEQ